MQIIARHNKKLSSKSIVGLYFAKFRTLTGIDFKPKPNEWSSFCGRVNSFKEREDISWEDYKEFVEVIFSYLIPSGYQPVFGMICSSKVYAIVKSHFGSNFVENAKEVVSYSSGRIFRDLQKKLYEGKYLHVLQKC